MKHLATGGGTHSYRWPCCVGPVAVKDSKPLRKDIANVKAAAAKHGAQHIFMNAASPGVVALFQPNQHHANDDDYLQALNLALAAIPADRVRMHVCWGNYEGPNHKEVPLATILPVMLKAKPQGPLFETSNPRHAYEWETVQAMKHLIPDNKVLIPGVLDATTNFVEHSRLVAQRIERFVGIVGRNRVQAGTDCVFGTFAGFGAMDADIVYAKFAAMAEGAALASSHCWR